MVLTTSYQYDSADRLTSRNITGSVTPFAGNSFGYSYDGNNSLITTTNTLTGTGSELTVNSYDSRNRLTGWQRLKSVGGSVLNSASYQYDGANTRLGMSYNGQTTSYLQDIAGGLPVVLQETIAGSGQPDSFLYPQGSTSPLFQTEPGASASGFSYHGDGLGSVRALTTGSGSVVADYAYSAYGMQQSTGDG